MPRVTKTTPPKTFSPQVRDRMVSSPSSTENLHSNEMGGILSRITPVGQSVTGVKLCVYGRPKTGKTRLACSFPKPLLLIGTEDGTKSVSTVVGCDFVRIESSEDIEILADHVKNGTVRNHGDVPYASVILDHAGGLQDIILKEVLGLKNLPVQRSWGMAQREQWMACGAQTKERLRMLLDLADRPEATNIVIIAHERNFSDDGQPSDIITPVIGAALQPSVAGWVNTAVDYIGQTHIRQKYMMKEIDIAGKKQRVKQLVGEEKEYCLRVGPHHIYLTGFRLPPDQSLPDSIVNPRWEEISQLIRGEFSVSDEEMSISS